MPRQLAPLFLARAVYRRRRLRDAARLLPVFGLFLLLFPLMWDAPDGSQAGKTLVYLFGAWLVLIGLAAYLAPGLTRPETEPEAHADPVQEGQDAV